MNAESLRNAATNRGKSPAAMPVPETGALRAVRNSGNSRPDLPIPAVDDGAPVLGVIAEALGDLGLRIVTCHDAGEGLAAFALGDGSAVTGAAVASGR
jgi:hypothetical protein